MYNIYIIYTYLSFLLYEYVNFICELYPTKQLTVLSLPEMLAHV